MSINGGAASPLFASATAQGCSKDDCRPLGSGGEPMPLRSGASISVQLSVRSFFLNLKQLFKAEIKKKERKREPSSFLIIPALEDEAGTRRLPHALRC
jgi:hypothetical protein